MTHDEPIEELYCALLFLLTRYARFPAPQLPAMIEDHLLWLANHPGAGDFHMLRDTCNRLALHWRPGRQAAMAPSGAVSKKQGRSILH